MTDHIGIGIIGSGAVGKAVGRLWAEAGRTVYFGSRNPANIKAEIELFGSSKARAVTLEEAAAKADVIFTALPYEVLEETYRSLSKKLAGKIVIEASNPWESLHRVALSRHSATKLPARTPQDCCQIVR